MMPWGVYLLTNNLHFDRTYLGIMKNLGTDLKINSFQTINYVLNVQQFHDDNI